MIMKIEHGDGSERCVVCGLRQPNYSLYAYIVGELNDLGEQVKFPVCRIAHAREWFAIYHRGQQIRLL